MRQPSAVQLPVVPVVPLVIEMAGSMILALGVVVIYAPYVLAGVLPGELLTPAVGWTAFVVGLAVGAIGAWQLVAELRRQALQRSAR